MISERISPNENFEYGNPHSNAFLQFELKLERCKPHKAAHHPTKCDIINDVKLYPIVYGRIYCHKFLTLSNQTSRYKLMCIRIISRLYQSYFLSYLLFLDINSPKLSTSSTCFWNRHLLINLCVRIYRSEFWSFGLHMFK